MLQITSGYHFQNLKLLVFIYLVTKIGLHLGSFFFQMPSKSYGTETFETSSTYCDVHEDYSNTELLLFLLKIFC